MEKPLHTDKISHQTGLQSITGCGIVNQEKFPIKKNFGLPMVLLSALFACLFGWLLLGENIFRWEYLGALVLICGGICLGNMTLNSKKEAIK